MTDYAKREMKALDRIAKKISDAEGHLTKIEDSIDDKKHHTAQHETIKDIKSILKHARKVDKDEDKIEEFKAKVLRIQQKTTTSMKKKNLLSTILRRTSQN